MNGQPLPILHGAPLRLRVETQLGFTMVKYIRAIEFIEDYKTIGQGQGGWREDYQYFSQEAGSDSRDLAVSQPTSQDWIEVRTGKETNYEHCCGSPHVRFPR